MGGSTFRNGDKWMTLDSKHRKMRIMVALLVLVTCLTAPIVALAQEKKAVAVLPFRIYAVEALDHLKKGLQQMFSARMAEYGFPVIDPDTVNKHPMAFLAGFERPEISTIGNELNADVIITGTLTQVGRKISLDVKLFDVSEEKPPFAVYMVEDDIDKLASAVDKTSRSLFNQITGVVQVDSVHVRGNRRIESEAILAVVETKKGESLDYDQMDKDLRAVYRMGFFKDVNIETQDGPKGKIVIFNVSEKPSIGNISFRGNKEEKADDLLKESGIKLYSILNRSEVRQSINRLKEYYRQKGYYNVQIEDRIEDLPQNEVSLIYEIDEGQKVYVKKIEFVGNEKFDDDDLKDVMDTSEKGLLSFITKSGLLDKRRLEFDLQKVTAFYHNHGYIRAKVGEPKVSYEEGLGLIITVEVIEGERYMVNKVKIEGDLIEPEQELLKKVTINKEEFFSRKVVRTDILALRQVYADVGYAYADVGPYVNEDDENHLVDITYKISKGQKVRFERINIAGNTQTRDKVIRRELEVVEGEVYSGEGIRKSNQNLQRLGFFEDVEFQTKKGSQDDLMVLNVNLKERATGFFSMGAGYSSFDKTYGSIEVAENNLFGTGRKLKALARIGSRIAEYNIRFVEPRLFDKRLSVGLDLYNWTVEYDEYTKDSFGGALKFGFPLGLDDYTRGSVRYLYDDSDITDIEETASIQIKDMAGRNVTNSLTATVARDTRDTLWYTTKGSENSISVEYAGPPLGGDVAFNRYEAETKWYFPFRWGTVFMLRAKGGYLDARPEDGKLPVYQKFLIGGINTVRGYDFASISPEDPATGDKIGGEKMIVCNFEYRFPLIKDQGVSGVVFFDAGNVWAKDDSYSFGSLRKSTGVGVRWYSPLGPLRLEYGFILDPGPDETRSDEDPLGSVEFTFGGSF